MYFLASDVKTSPSKRLPPTNPVGCQFPLRALQQPFSVLLTFFSTHKQIKGQVNTTASCPSSPSSWWRSHMLAFLSSSTESHFLLLPHCRLHVSITTISARCNCPNFAFYLLLRESGREHWACPTQPVTPKSCGDTRTSLWATFQATQCHYGKIHLKVQTLPRSKQLAKRSWC